jgi:hypothetical protein
MRTSNMTIALALVALTATGCGKAALPTMKAAPSVGSVASAAAPRPAMTVQAGIISNGAASINSNNTANAIAAGELPPGFDPMADLDLAYADANPPTSPAAEAAEDARLAALAKAAADEPPPYDPNDRTPYGVVVVERSAHTATIAWRTNAPTKGLIEFTKTRDFLGNKLLRKAPKGFTGCETAKDDVAKTDHKYVITGLSRYTSYTFKVTAVTPLGLKFPEKEHTLRTKFWAWR